MKIWIQYAWKELKNNSRFCLFFVLNLSLGLVGFIALNSFNDSLKLHLEENLKNILTGDFAVFSNRPLKEEETKIIYKTIGKEYEESRQIIFFSMIAGKKQARLAQIVAIDSKFPLYGNFSLNGKQKVIPKLIQENLQKKPSVWMYPEVRTTLGTQLQGTIKIGLKRFSISKEIHEDPSGALSNMGLAPKIYIGLSQVKDTGLIQKGSRVSYVRFFKIPSHVDAEKLTKVLREKFKKKYGRTSDVSVRSHKDASRRLSQLLDYVTGYLGLIAIIALFLAGIGAAYLFRGYLQNRIQDMAILMSLGASKKESYTVLFIQLIILGAGSAILAILISALLIPYTPQVLQGIMPSNFIAKINISSLFLAFGLGSLGSIIFCLPVMVRINQMKPSQLFQEASQPVQQINNGKFQTFLSYLPALLAFWGLAVWQSQSLKEGTTFIILFLGALFILGFIGWGILSLCGKLSNRQHVIVGMAFRNLHRHRMAAISCFLAISLGAFLINLIPQLHQGLQKEIERPNGLTIPSFFLFDIQPEQVQAIRKFLKQEGYHLANLSPMVRARLEKINNRSLKIKPTNAQRQRNLEERRLRRRGFNLSYRKSLSSSEGITKGKPLATTYNLDSNKPAEISVEERFAKRFKLKLGDTLSFDVQGISIQGKIVNFRSVRWNSFQPNFFILFQTGVLESAPQTFLASIAKVKKSRKGALQNGIVKQFPNVSMVDVSKIVDKLLDIAGRMSWAIQSMAYLSIVAGLVVVYSIARTEARTRNWEINLLKVLGASFQDIRKIILIEFGVLGLFAAFFGIILSVAVSSILSYFLFSNIWEFSWGMNLFSFIVIGMISMTTALFATYDIIRQKPWKILKAS